MSADHPASGEDALLARFQPIFDEIAAGALRRERERVLAVDEVRRLREAGFGALRVPRERGGEGVSLLCLFRLLTALAEADSNLPQILRAHFAFVEGCLVEPDDAENAVWLRRVADGDLFGAAMAERTPGTETTTVLAPRGDGWVLNGEKYYSTGTLYASWIVTVAKDGADRLRLLVPADAPGVTIEDDWDGFGQRLTGSGTTRFRDVALQDGHLYRRAPEGEVPSDTAFLAFYQLVHLAGLAGLARAARRDAVAFVRQKTRTFGVPGQNSPRHDPLVQRVVGRISSNAFAAEALVDQLARQLDDIEARRRTGADVTAACLAADIAAFEAQQVAIDLVLAATTLLFEVGGASATSTALALDRHWRNARVLASHNPAAQRERAIGDYRLNDADPSDVWRGAFTPPAAGTGHA